MIIPTDDGLVEGSETIIITVEIINECGDTITTEATIEITDPVEFELVMDDITLECAEDSVMITFDPVGGIPEYDIDWSSGAQKLKNGCPVISLEQQHIPLPLPMFVVKRRVDRWT